MKTIALALAALAGTATAAQAQLPAGQGIPEAMHGRWAINARACRTGELGPGIIEVNESGYVSDGERNAAIRSRIGARGGRYTYDVIFSAVADRQWQGRMTLRQAGARLGVTNARNAERLYVRCRG
jgi:hypothetical protein